MATRTIADAGGNWSAIGTWVEGAVPLVGDDVVATATSGPLVQDTAAATCRSMDLNLYTSTFSGSAAMNIGTSTAQASNIALRCGASMTWTYTGGISFSTTQASQTITFNGIHPTSSFTFVSASSGSWTIVDDWTVSGARTFAHQAGTVDCTGRTITVARYNNTGTSTRALNLTNATLNITGTSGIGFDVASATGFTLTLSNTTINIAGAASTWKPQGKSFAGATVNLTGTGVVVVTGQITGGPVVTTNGPTGLTLPASTTHTLGASSSLVGIPANGPLTLKSATGGTASTISIASGTVTFNHNIIQDITATGGATFTAFDSQNVSGNTGITFNAAKTGQLLAGVAY